MIKACNLYQEVSSLYTDLGSHLLDQAQAISSDV